MPRHGGEEPRSASVLPPRPGAEHRGRFEPDVPYTSVLITADFFFSFSFSDVWACSPANVKSLLFTYRSTKLQRMGLGDTFSILRHADGNSIFTQNQQQIEMLQKKKKKKDFV